MKTNIEKTALSGIRSFSEYCQQFEDIVYLTIGEPDYDTPEAIKQVAVQALSENMTHYPPAIGTKKFRDAVSQFESKLYNQPLTSDNVIAVNGATEGLTLALWSTLNQGDAFIVPTPCFALYFSQIELIGATVTPLYNEDIDFQIDEEHFNACLTENTKGILLTSPNNPTGAVLSKESLDVIYRYAKAHPDFVIILDDVYAQFIYEGEYSSLRYYPEIQDQIILVQSFSKSYAMTGWRLGYVVASEARIESMHKLHQNLVTGVAPFIQEAGVRALTFDNRYMIEDYKKRRDYVYSRLIAMGLDVKLPEGAFYIFPNIRKFGLDSLAFAKKCLKEAKVAVIPGIYFGQDGYVRLSYCYDMEDLKEAMDRLEGFIALESKNIV